MSSHKDWAEASPGSGVDPNHPAEQGYKIEVVDGRNGITRVTDGQGNKIPMRKHIAIVGFAASSRDLAPLDDDTYEIWGLNQIYRHLKRETRHFDIHANWREDNVPGTDHPRWLAECGIPVFMSAYEESIPTCVQYPLDDVIKHTTGIDYFTSTVAFMVAYAIKLIDEQVEADALALGEAGRRGAREGASDEDKRAFEVLLHPQAFRQWLQDRYGERTIALYGIDLIVGTEWDYQKSCVEFLLGLAHTRGIRVNLPPYCALLRQRWRYGYQTEPQGDLVRMTEVDRRGSALKGEKDKLLTRLYTLDGAIQENSYWSQVMDLRSKGGAVKLNEE